MNPDITITIDNKVARLSEESYRALVEQHGIEYVITLTKAGDALLLCPLDKWDNVIDMLNQLDGTGEDERKVKMQMIGHAHDVVIKDDKVLEIPEYLLEAVRADGRLTCQYVDGCSKCM